MTCHPGCCGRRRGLHALSDRRLLAWQWQGLRRLEFDGGAEARGRVDDAACHGTFELRVVVAEAGGALGKKLRGRRRTGEEAERPAAAWSFFLQTTPQYFFIKPSRLKFYKNTLSLYKSAPGESTSSPPPTTRRSASSSSPRSTPSPPRSPAPPPSRASSSHTTSTAPLRST